jgi:PKHD-type hydroxylase
MKLQATYLHIEQLLNAELLKQIEMLSGQAAFEDGRKTASAAAREVKNNLQIDGQSQAAMTMQQVLLGALNQSKVFRDATFIKNIYPFLFSKYEPGMQYGWHVDSPLMGGMMRTDIAITIFLNDPSEYDGGELELQSPTGTLLYKLAAGDAICYPCTQLHRVREVTRGQRRVAVSWIESMVKSSDQRKVLFDIQQVIDALREKDIQSEEANLLQQNHSNLVRMWAQ